MRTFWILLSLALFTGITGLIVSLVGDDDEWSDEEEEVTRRRLAGYSRPLVYRGIDADDIEAAESTKPRHV